jgi:hypothetical protein
LVGSRIVCRLVESVSKITHKANLYLEMAHDI